MTDHEQFYRLAMARIYRNLLALAAIGTVGFMIWKGWAWGSGFLAGAAASAVNFWLLHRMVDSLGEPAQEKRSTGALAWTWGFRYLMFGGTAYVIVKYFRINPFAILAGLLVVVAAVLLEILYELIYARA